MKNSIYFILLVLVISGCGTTKISSIETEFTRDLLKIVTIEDSLARGWNYNGKINIAELNDLPPGEVKVINDTSANGEFRGQIKYWKNSYGDVIVECLEKDQLITSLRKETTVDIQEEKLVKKGVLTRYSWKAFKDGMLAGVIVVILLWLMWRFMRISSPYRHPNF